MVNLHLNNQEVKSLYALFINRSFLLIMLVIVASGGCGKAQPFETGEELGAAVLGGNGGSRVSSTASVQSTIGTAATSRYVTVTRQRALPKPTYNIVPVTMIYEASDDRVSWNLANFPFIPAGANNAQRLEKIFAYGADTYIPAATGTPATASNGGWPIAFDFNYPQNNFQLQSVHLVVETKRDNSDTEGILVDGVFSGRPPASMVNTTSPAITHPVYQNETTGVGANGYYIDFSLAHYRRDQRNFFDLDMTNLLTGTTKTPYEIVSDDHVKVVLGDDSPVYKGYLVIKGLTISSSQLTCVTSSSFDYRNTLVHNDGNSIGQGAFTGTIKPLYQAWSDPVGQNGSEFYFDTALPDTDLTRIHLTSASIFFLKAKKSAAGCPTLIINGVGFGSSSCNRALANPVVLESWDEVATSSAAWTNFVSQVPTDTVGADLSLDLLALLGEQKMLTLLKQGKFNVALGGSLVAKSVNGSNALSASSSRGFRAPVDGPELVFAGTYTVENCTVVDSPTSPMTEAGFIEPPEPATQYEEYTEEVLEGTPEVASVSTVLNDGVSPVIASLQVQDITSTSVTIYWTTDEAATSAIKYGIISPNVQSPEDSSLATFHKVVLTNLSPYKFYKYQVISKDRYGNESNSDVALFTTLR